MTNRDKLRQMSDEELAEFVCGQIHCMDCIAASLCEINEERANGLIKWFKAEAEEEE